MSFPRVFWAPFGEEYKTYTDGIGKERYDIGQKMQLPDGRTFRFGRTGATTLVAGTLVQSAVQVFTALTPVAAAAGATSISLALSATAMDFDMHAGGVLTAELVTGSGAGYSYPLPRGQANQAASASPVAFALQTGYQVQVAINTTDRISLIQNPWHNVVINATAQTSPCVGAVTFPAVTHGTISATGGNALGVAMGDLTWIQTGGLCALRTDNTTVVAGQPCTASTVTAGDISLLTTTNVITSPIVGQIVRIGASTGFSTVNLMIADY